MTPPLAAKLAQLGQYIEELRGWLNTPRTEEWGPALERILERMVQLVIECAADAGDLWLQDRGRAPGNSATDVFRLLSEAGAIDRKMYGRLRDHTRTRNRIVHDYDEITSAEVRQDAEVLAQDAADLLQRLLAGP